MKKRSIVLFLLAALVLSALLPAACGSGRAYDRAARNLRAAGYSVGLQVAEAPDEDGVVATIEARKTTDDGMEVVRAVFYKDEESAAADRETRQTLFAAAAKSERNAVSTITFGFDNTVAYSGTENAIRAMQ